MVIKVTYFGVSGKANTDHYIIILALFPKVPKTSVRNPRKSKFSIIPLSLDASSPRNLHEYPHKPYIARNYTAFPLTVRVYLHSNFRVGLKKRMYFETECEIAVQRHPT